MILPKIITHSTVSLDGRLTLAPGVLLLHGDPRWDTIGGESSGVYEKVKTLFQPQAVLEGSGSFVTDDTPFGALPPVSDNPGALYEDYLPSSVVNVEGRKWFTAVDGRGRVRWFYKEFPSDEWKNWHLLVLVSHSTPPEYLAYLQREQIPYLVAGENHVNLRGAMEKMKAKLGVSCVLSTAGGKLNGALLRAGLIDEISVEFLPAVIGGLGTPSLFDAVPLQPDEVPVKLTLCQHLILPDGKVWLHYQVQKGV